VKELTEPYVDDVAVYSMSWVEHLQHIRSFLVQMRKHNVTLNLKKCEFGKPEIKFIGHVVGSGHKRMDPEKVKVMLDMPEPTTKTQLRRLLGLLNYYRQFIQDFAKIAQPLTDVTGKNKPESLLWTEEQQEAFVLLKHALCYDVVLKIFHLGQTVNLYCDSSDGAVGAVLTQCDSKGNERPVYLISQKLTATQQRWATIEKEAYAIVWALSKLKEVILGSHIVIYTDHNPLTYLTMTMSKSAKLVRWGLALQAFDLEIKYKKGKLNVVADCLSRL